MSSNPMKWEEVGIANDFMFGKVMKNPELCKELLQRIFPELLIDRIEYQETQKTIENDHEAHGVRLDVYVKDDVGTVYTIEMQASDTRELPKRSRYYQSMIDLQLLDKGESYAQLNHSYVIFICPFDLFGTGRHIYTFENICLEDSSIHLDDGAIKLFLNAKGTLNDVDVKLKAFLDYVAGKKSDDSFVRKLEEAVREAKKNREWRREYMTLYMRDLENREMGRQEGRFDSLDQLLSHNTSLTPEQGAEMLGFSKEELEEYLTSRK